jgi:hypothetical protein
MATIGVPGPGTSGEMADEAIHVSLIHIVKIEYIAQPSAPPTGTNGPTGTT